MGSGALYGDMNMPDPRWVIDPETGCWNWHTGATYPSVRLNGGAIPAHVAMYTIKYGDIRQGFELDHTCRNPRCVNPDHLEAVTHQENMRRALSHPDPGRFKCGHPRTPENTYYINSRQRGGMVLVCRACRKADANRRYAAKRAVEGNL